MITIARHALSSVKYIMYCFDFSFCPFLEWVGDAVTFFQSTFLWYVLFSCVMNEIHRRELYSRFLFSRQFIPFSRAPRWKWSSRSDLQRLRSRPHARRRATGKYSGRRNKKFYFVVLLKGNKAIIWYLSLANKSNFLFSRCHSFCHQRYTDSAAYSRWSKRIVLHRGPARRWGKLTSNRMSN